MSMKEAVIHVLTNYATFEGRARRSEYWYFVLFNMVVHAALGLLGSIFFGSDSASNLFTVLSSLYGLAVFIPNLAVTWRRLHDIGKSGACYFMILIPLVGPILLLVWLLRDSEPGSNAYGPNPKETDYV